MGAILRKLQSQIGNPLCRTSKTYQLVLNGSWPTRTIRRASALNSPRFDYDCDVLVVGSGAGALTAGLRAQSQSLKALLVEKSSKLGGTSSYSGGAAWVPNNPLSVAAGLQDSTEKALSYMEAVIPEKGPVSSEARRRAYLAQSLEMLKFTEQVGFKWKASVPYPDYHCLAPGSSAFGRTVEAKIFNLRNLGSWRKLMLTPPSWTPAVETVEARSLFRMGASLTDFAIGMKVILTSLLRMAAGQLPVSLGQAMIGQLLFLNKQLGTEIWRESPLLELITDENGAVIGGVVQRDGRRLRVRAAKGVVLAAGGFSRNKTMRKQYLRHVRTDSWSTTAPHDHGDAVRAGEQVGGATAMLEHAWWMPVNVLSGQPDIEVASRAFPHSIIVDKTGSRFLNEATDYCDVGAQIQEHNEAVPAVPCWLILDSVHRRKYMLGRMLPGVTPKSAIKPGQLYKDDTITGLAKQIGVDRKGLVKTIERFNKFAHTGVDKDFDRGLNPYDNVFSDPKNKPNPNLGTIAKPPFYATPLYPGDLGTKGGLITDEYARVLKEDGTPIQRLYASGNTTASVMGSTYPGAGATLGPAMTFAFVAVNHIKASMQ